MNLAKNEYTTQTLLDLLKKKYKKKITGEEFNHSDIAQYCLRGNIPYRYGGQKLKVSRDKGVKIIQVIER